MGSKMSRHITLKTEEGFQLSAEADRFSTFYSAFAEIRADLNFGMLGNDDLTITLQKRPPSDHVISTLKPYLMSIHDQMPTLTCLGVDGLRAAKLIQEYLPCKLRGVGGKIAFGKSDLIYSNVLDQVDDPIAEIGQWIEALNDNGFLFLDYSDFQRSSAVLQNKPFAIFERMMVQFMNREFSDLGVTLEVINVPDGTVRGGRLVVFQKYITPLLLQ
jgi:hypothetical protein